VAEVSAGICEEARRDMACHVRRESYQKMFYRRRRE